MKLVNILKEIKVSTPGLVVFKVLPPLGCRLDNGERWPAPRPKPASNDCLPRANLGFAVRPRRLCALGR